MLHTGLKPEEALAGLESVVKRGKPFAVDLPRGDVPLRGIIDGRRFTVVRRTQYWNTFTPIAAGEVVEVEGGSQVLLRCTMHLVPFVSLIIWALVCVVMVIGLEVNDALSGPLVAVVASPAVGPLAGWLLWRFELDALVADVTVGLTRRVR
ncbi:MAG: hypothetical protein INH41_05725 [Myxococcaceae bacterium]|nr:hypothetical protein [Myxococcaceae bacterium]